MKKDRNSFFSQFGSYGYQTNPQMNTGVVMPNMATNIPQQQYINSNTIYDDYDARISKLEREIARLDQRVTNLENSLSSVKTTTNNAQTDFNFANSMYIV